MSGNTVSTDNSKEDKAEKTPTLVQNVGEVLINKWIKIIHGLYRIYDVVQGLWNELKDLFSN